MPGQAAKPETTFAPKPYDAFRAEEPIRNYEVLKKTGVRYKKQMKGACRRDPRPAGVCPE